MTARRQAAPGEDDFQALFHNAGVGITLVDGTGRFLRVNEMYTAIVGRSEAELLRLTVGAVTHPDDRQADIDQMGCLRSGEIPFYSVEKRLIRPDGSVVWVRVNVHPVPDATRRLARTVSVIEDIGPRKAAEEALQASEARLRLALEASAAGVWSYDPEGDVTTWDDTVTRHYGHDPSLPPASGRWLDAVHPQDRPAVEALLRSMMYTPGHDRWDQEFRSIRPDGSVVWHHGLGRADRSPDGSVTRLIGIDLDITSRKAAELAAQENEQRLRLVLEAAGASSWICDPRTGVVTLEGPVPAGLGLPPGSTIPLDALLDKAPSGVAEQVYAMRADIIAGTSDGWSVDYHVDGPDDGERRWYRCVIHAKRDDAGSVSWISAISLETTELEIRNRQLRELASQLVMAEQQVREQIAQTLHDHLQQLLYSAAVTLDRVTANVDHDAAATRLLAQTRATLAEAIDAARTLSSELFPPELHDHGLPVALEHLIRQVRRQHDVEVEVSVDASADPSAQDKRIFVYEAARELLFNAIKHARARQHTIVLEVTADDQIRLIVSDDGIGFDPDEGPVATDGHRGLGLTRLRQRVPLVPGRLDVQSRTGHGTRVTLQIPR